MTGPTTTSKQGNRKPGRPRDPSADRAILQSALKLLADQGYTGMSIEQVAAEAGVGKTTIYRRHATKEELVAAAIGALRDELGPPPNTGNARSDIVEMILQIQDVLELGPGFAMIGALLVEERRNPELLEMFRERIVQPRLDEAITILQRGVSRGEMRTDVDLEVTVQAIFGSILARRIMGAPESRRRIEETVDTIWRGLAADPPD